VKAFLKKPGGIDLYPDASIKWIRGHDPTLYVYEADMQIKEVSLGSYDEAGLHRLFAGYFGPPKDSRQLQETVNWTAPAAFDFPANDTSALKLRGGAFVDTMGLAADVTDTVGKSSLFLAKSVLVMISFVLVGNVVLVLVALWQRSQRKTNAKSEACDSVAHVVC